MVYKRESEAADTFQSRNLHNILNSYREEEEPHLKRYFIQEKYSIQYTQKLILYFTSASTYTVKESFSPEAGGNDIIPEARESI